MCHCEDFTLCFYLFLFRLILRQLRFFGKCGPPYDQTFSAKKKEKKNPGGQASGWACRTRAKFQGQSLTNGVDIWTSCVKMSKMRYFLQICELARTRILPIRKCFVQHTQNSTDRAISSAQVAVGIFTSLVAAAHMGLFFLPRSHSPVFFNGCFLRCASVAGGVSRPRGGALVYHTGASTTAVS